MFSFLRRRLAPTTLADGEMVIARIVSVEPHPTRPGFLVVYEIDGGRREALLPCDPLPRGGQLVQPGRTLRLTVFDDGGLIVDVEALIAARLAVAA